MSFKKNVLSGLFTLAFVMAGAGNVMAEYIASQQSNDDDRPVAIVRRANPDVNVKHAKATEWVQSEVGQPLFNNDTLKTGEDGFAVLHFMDNSVVKVKPNSEIVVKGEVTDKNNTAFRLVVNTGGIFINVTKRLTGQSVFEVKTPTGVASVLGTSFETKVSNMISTYLVHSGLVSVAALNSGQTVQVNRGNKASIDEEGNSINIEEVSEEEMNNSMNDFDDLEDDSSPKTLRFQFVNDEGQVQNIELQYFENN